MSENEITKQKEDQKPEKHKKKSSCWKRLLKITGFSLLGIILLILGAITVAVAYLQPERLTPLVEKYANEYLNAEVKIERVEISFWSTFPKFVLDVDNLRIKSKALDKLPEETRRLLPAEADSLLSLDKLHASLSIPKIIRGKIGLYDVIFTHPRINVVQATPELSNMDIFPQSKEEKKEEKPLKIPDITIGEFRIDDGMPVRYFSLPDTTDLSLTLRTMKIDGEGVASYALDIQGLTDAKISGLQIKNLSIGADGEIEWKHDDPYKIKLEKFSVALNDVKAYISSELDFEGDMKVNALDFELPFTKLSSLIALIPADMRGELTKVKPQLTVGLKASLLHPYLPSSGKIPSVRAELEIPEGSVTYEQFKLDKLSLRALAEIDGNRLDASTVKIERLKAQGDGVGVELNVLCSNLISDPRAEGWFKGTVDVSKLPASLLQEVPGTVKGILTADSHFNIRKSYLDKDNFHRLRVDGNISLKNLDVSIPMLPVELYSHDMEMKFGTSSSFKTERVDADSLLTVSLNIDTIFASVTGMVLEGKSLKMGVGCQNTASSADTALINPIGGRIKADMVKFKMPDDSMRVRLRDATIGASLKRFKGDKNKAQLHMDVRAGSGFYGDKTMRAMLRDAILAINIHPSAPPTLAARKTLSDSLALLYPDLPADSIALMAKNIRKERRDRRLTADSLAVANGEVLDMGLDHSMSRLLRQWDARGVLKAKRMRVFTPVFPLQNTLSDLNMRFTSDSLIIKDTKLRTGRSTLTVNGTVSNITRALTSRTHNQPLCFNFRLKGDTVDINQIAAATFAGAAYAENDKAFFTMTDTDDEQALQASVQSVATDTISVLVVPANLEGNISVTAKHILYSNLSFNDFKGRLNVHDGAINLEQLGAKTEVGSVNLNALYSAKSKDMASFAFGLNVKDLRIRHFLDLMPSLDSIIPLLSDISGIINADVAATSDLDSQMNLKIPTLKAAVKISGDSLVLVDQQTFKKIGKWLLFKNKERNVIDKMTVEMLVQDSRLDLFPFIFDLDRYRLGVMGTNDMAMNLNYHVAVLKSPIPFKFGINISGNMDNMKIRLGKAKFNENKLPQTVAIADTTRINLVKEIGNIFRRGVRNSNTEIKSMNFSRVQSQMHAADGGSEDTISRADSLYFIREGLLPAPDTTLTVGQPPVQAKSRKRKGK